MAIEGAAPIQFGQGSLNMWAMLKSQIANGIGLAPISGAPTNGTSGTYATFAGKGMLLVDIDTGIIYKNDGTKASPIWNQVSGAVAGPAGLGSISNAKATYDFAVDGGVQGTITPFNSPTIPAGAIILGGVLDITTALTSGGSATIGAGLGAGAQVAALKAPLAVASWTVNTMLAVIPVFTVATYVKVAAATRLTFTVATADLLTGKVDLNIAYVQGNV